MQQAEGLFQFDFGLPVYENLIVNLVNVATSCAVPLIMLCTEAIYSLSASIKALYAVVFALYSGSFGRMKIVLQEIHIILAKFAPQGLENRKILDSDPG